MTIRNGWWTIFVMLLAACASQGDEMRVVVPRKTTYLHAEAVDGGTVEVPPRVLEEVRPLAPERLGAGPPSVVLSFLVDARGGISRIRIDRADDERMIDLATAAIARWKLRPARRDGRAIPVTATVQLTFDAPRAEE